MCGRPRPYLREKTHQRASYWLGCFTVRCFTARLATCGLRVVKGMAYTCWKANSENMAELTPEILRAARKALAAAGGKARARKLSKRRQSEIGRYKPDFLCGELIPTERILHLRESSSGSGPGSKFETLLMQKQVDAKRVSSATPRPIPPQNKGFSVLSLCYEVYDSWHHCHSGARPCRCIR